MWWGHVVVLGQLLGQQRTWCRRRQRGRGWERGQRGRGGGEGIRGWSQECYQKYCLLKRTLYGWSWAEIEKLWCHSFVEIAVFPSVYLLLCFLSPLLLRLYVCLFACLSLSVSVCLCLWLSMCLCLSVSVSVCLCLCLSVSLSLRMVMRVCNGKRDGEKGGFRWQKRGNISSGCYVINLSTRYK